MLVKLKKWIKALVTVLASICFAGLNGLGVYVPSEALPFILLSDPAHRRFPFNYLFGSFQPTLAESFFYSWLFVCLEVILTVVSAFWLVHVAGHALHKLAAGLERHPPAKADPSLPWHRYLWEETKNHFVYVLSQLSHFVQYWHSRGGWWPSVIVVFTGFMTGCLKFGIALVIMSGRLTDLLLLFLGVGLKQLLVCYSVPLVNWLLDQKLTWYVAIVLFVAFNVFFFIKRRREVRSLSLQYSQP